MQELTAGAMVWSVHAVGLSDHESGLEIYYFSAMQCVIIGSISMVYIVFAAVCIFKTYLHAY